MLEQTAKSRDEKTQEIITSSFVDVARRVRSGVSPNLAVVQVISETLETLQNNSLTLTPSNYTLWGNALSIFAKEQAQLHQMPQAVMPQRKQAGLSQVVLGCNTKTGKDVNISDEERMSGMHVLGATGTG